MDRNLSLCAESTSICQKRESTKITSLERFVDVNEIKAFIHFTHSFVYLSILYSCILCDPAFEWKQGWLPLDTNLFYQVPMLISFWKSSLILLVKAGRFGKQCYQILRYMGPFNFYEIGRGAGEIWGIVWPPSAC